jgi:hypothetical protein
VQQNPVPTMETEEVDDVIEEVKCEGEFPHVRYIARSFSSTGSYVPQRTGPPTCR